MLTCKEITKLATDFAEGHLAEEYRRQFVAHVAGCRGCATWVRQLETASRALGALPAQPLPEALQARLLAQFDGWAMGRGAAPPARASLEAPGRRPFVLIPAVGAVLAFGLLVGLARSPSGATGDWVIAVGLLVLAVALVVRRQRVTLGFAAVAAAAALLAAVVLGGHGPLEGGVGAECVLVIGVTAAVAAGAAWAVLRRQPGEIRVPAMGAWAVAGALASVAALQIACGARSSLAHLLTFHFGGLLVVILAAAMAPRLLARPASA